MHALKSVEGILYFDLSINNLQSLGCIEIAKLLRGNEYNQGFCELKRLNLNRNNITDEAVKHLATALTYANCIGQIEASTCPPRATPREFDFFENFCSNSLLPGPKCRSNAPH